MLCTALIACRHTVSGSISLPSPGFFSPFPHGTRSLSVIRQSLALEGGPPSFPQGSTCPVVLRIPLRCLYRSAYGPVTPSGCPFQNIQLPYSVPTYAVLQPPSYNEVDSRLYGAFRKKIICFLPCLLPTVCCLLGCKRGLGSSPFARRY